MGEKIRGAAALLVLGTLCMGALITWPLLWLVPFGLFCWWVRVNERRIEAQKINIPAPPPVPGPSPEENMQVTEFGNGAGMLIKTRDIRHTTGHVLPSEKEEAE